MFWLVKFSPRKKPFLESLEDATKDSYGYLILDLTPSCPERYRVRSGILPDHWPIIYLPKNKLVTMSQHIKRNAILLQALYRASPQKCKDIAHSSPDFLQALCEIALNLLKGNIPLSTSQYKKLQRQKKKKKKSDCWLIRKPV